MKHGFTIIELLIVVLISTALVGVGVAGYRDFAMRQEIDASMRIISSDLRRAQSLALSGVKPETGCTGTFNGYRFRFTSNAGQIVSYSTAPVCNNTDLVATTTVLPTTVLLSLSPSGTTSILFRPLGQGTDLPSGNPMTITIQSSGTFTGRRGTIRVTATGEID